MEFTSTALRCVSMLCILLLTTAISPAAASTLPSGLQLMCEGSPLTHSQRNLCHQYPELFMYLLRNGTSLFQHQCHHQFKHEKWNCSNINLLPLFGTIQPFLSLESKEAAFVYALATATVVHAVAKECARHDGNALSYCGCDSTLEDEKLEPGQRWGKCSPDVDFSMNFAKQLLDGMISDNATSEQHKTFISHNSKIGQLVFSEGMRTTCGCIAKKCKGQQICTMKLPKLEELAKELKIKYEQSLCIAPSSLPQEGLGVDNEKKTEGKLIYFKELVDYCTANSLYNISGTIGRECIVDDKHYSSSNHCSNLCCGRGEEEFTVIIKNPCKCKFVWCCKVECLETCSKEETRHRCK